MMSKRRFKIETNCMEQNHHHHHQMTISSKFTRQKQNLYFSHCNKMTPTTFITNTLWVTLLTVSCSLAIASGLTATTTQQISTTTTNKAPQQQQQMVIPAATLPQPEPLLAPAPTSSATNQNATSTTTGKQLSSNSNQQQQSLLAADSKLFEVCKLQSRQQLQLTNLSQIMFQPSEICSSWYRMLKTNIKSPTSSSADSTNSIDNQEASSYPWFYIELLDLSQNNLTVLHDNDGFNRLYNLLELRITQNQLTRCEENSLLGLQKLQILDISHNKLMALPTKFFQPVKHTIKKLNLSFNSISVLVPTLFDSLSQLEYLDLSHNEITSHWINDRLFKNLTKLHYLDLSFNRLTVFSSPMTFNSLQQLETLSLQHNELRQVPETIQHLRYLSTLDLSQNLIHDITNASYLSNCRQLFNLNLESNLLENITRDAFSDLPALKVLNLANNRIQHLDQQAFDYVPDLHALRLDSNRLIDFGQAFVNLRFLLMLNISSNRISSFDYAQIPFGLQWLDLHSNKIDKLNNFYYSPTAQQQFSANDINGGSSIGQQWQSMLRLTTLDASFNLIKEIDNTSLPESLETVQLNNNHIKNIASHTFTTKANLTRINLSHNQLSTMSFDALKLHGFRDTQQQQLQQSQSLLTNGQKFVDIYLANNPYICNCNTGWLSQLLLASSTLFQANNFSGNHLLLGSSSLREHQLILTRQLPRIADASLVNCQLPFSRQQTIPSFLTQSPEFHLWSPVGAANQLAIHHHHNHHLHSRDTPLISKQSELLASVHLCPYKSHCFALCFCCDFDACDCEMSCPEGCSCYYDQTWSTNIVDCSANNQINGMNHHFTSKQHQHRLIPQQVRFTNIPDKIPMDVTELYLDGLELSQLKANALIGRRNLKSLYLNNSQLYSIEPKALATQKSLRILQLNSNYLTELHGYEFEQQVDLRELYLANNQLTSIANTTFTPLRSLQVLHLQNNQLYHLNFWSNLPTGHKLISLNMGFNPWSCQCDHVGSLLQWIHSNVKHLHDRKSVTCQYNKTNSLHLVPPLISSSNTALVSSDDSFAAFDSLNENYPMFDMRMCLNYTVVVNSPSSSIKPTYPNEPSKTDVLNQRDIGSMNQPDDLYTSSGSSIQSLPNDEPFWSTSRPSTEGIRSQIGIQQDIDGLPINPIPNEYQFPPTNSKSINILNSTHLLGMLMLAIISIIIITILIYHRRSMGMWFYSRYGLNMFAATKNNNQHHHHAIGPLGKHSQLQHHLHHHQCGASSTGSTSSSSAASSNLSQALCHQQQHQQQQYCGANAAASGLVTTPLIVSSNHQLFNSNTSMTNSSPYNDEDKLFDAYVTYSKLDEQFINDCIAPELEYGQPSYRVALHYRDLPVTTSEFLTDCIKETANASRRIIMILSENMLKTEWMHHEFRSAHLEALKSNYRHRLIIILLGQPSLATLDADIVQWLKSCASIQWADKMFWQRLRFAMPELPFNRQQPQYLRYQTLAPHQTGGKQQKMSKASLGVNLLKSAGGLLTGSSNNNHFQQQQQYPAQMQQLITSNSMNQSMNRPLPSQPTTNNLSGGASSASSHYMQTSGSSTNAAEEHHYAHLTPATMIYNQQQQQQSNSNSNNNTYHQPIYGDPAQQQQQQQQCNGRDNPSVPVHI